MQYEATQQQVSRKDRGVRIVTARIRHYFINDNVTVCQMRGVSEGQYFSCLFYSLFCFTLFFFKCANSSRGKSSTNSLERKIRCLEKQRKEVILKY